MGSLNYIQMQLFLYDKMQWVLHNLVSRGAFNQSPDMQKGRRKRKGKTLPAAFSVKVPFLYSSSGSAHLRGANRGATEALAVRILEVSLLLRMQHSLEDLTWVCSAFSWTSTYQAVTLHLMSPRYLFQTLLSSSSSRDYLPLFHHFLQTRDHLGLLRTLLTNATPFHK